MQITLSKHGKVTVMHIMGDVDSSTYTDVIRKAQEVYDEGARDLLLDLEKVPYVSSAGLMALHSVARIYAGHSLSNADGGRPTFRSINPKYNNALPWASEPVSSPICAMNVGGRP